MQATAAISIRRWEKEALTISVGRLLDTARPMYPPTSSAEPMSTQRKNHERYLKNVCHASTIVGKRNMIATTMARAVLQEYCQMLSSFGSAAMLE